MAASEPGTLLLAAWEARTVACGWYVHGCLSLGLPNLVGDGPQQGASRGLGAGMGCRALPTLREGKYAARLRTWHPDPGPGPGS